MYAELVATPNRAVSWLSLAQGKLRTSEQLASSETCLLGLGRVVDVALAIEIEFPLNEEVPGSSHWRR